MLFHFIFGLFSSSWDHLLILLGLYSFLLSFFTSHSFSSYFIFCFSYFPSHFLSSNNYTYNSMVSLYFWTLYFLSFIGLWITFHSFGFLLHLISLPHPNPHHGLIPVPISPCKPNILPFGSIPLHLITNENLFYLLDIYFGSFIVYLLIKWISFHLDYLFRLIFNFCLSLSSFSLYFVSLSFASITNEERELKRNERRKNKWTTHSNVMVVWEMNEWSERMNTSGVRWVRGSFVPLLSLHFNTLHYSHVLFFLSLSLIRAFTTVPSVPLQLNISERKKKRSEEWVVIVVKETKR